MNVDMVVADCRLRKKNEDGCKPLAVKGLRGDTITKQSGQCEQAGSHGVCKCSPLGVPRWLNLNHISYDRFIFILVNKLTSNLKFPPTEDLIILWVLCIS